MAPRAKSSGTAAKPARPTYSVMVGEALRALSDRTGSSVPAITKQLVVLYKMQVNKPALRSALKKGVDSGELIKVKASYKIAKKEPAPKAKTTKKSATTTTVTTTTATKKKKGGVTKKTITKKSTTKPKTKTTTKKKTTTAKTTTVAKPKAAPRKPPAKRGTRTSSRTRK